MALHNKVNNRILKEKLKTIQEPRTTLSFYKYHHLDDPKAFRDMLYLELDKLVVWGRIYIASEGINAQLSVPTVSFDAFRQYLNSIEVGTLAPITFLKDVRLNIAAEDNGKSFFKLKIQVKSKIVADGLNDKTFDVTDSGTHLTAKAFNQLADDPASIIVDMRNHYESEVGRFKNAICPDVDTFREELQAVETLLENNKDNNVLMYCTGGIRCEKASAWMKHKGFKNVFQLDGGIIEYARQVKEQDLENKFVGKNFVFDERLGERISDEIISVCHQCGKPCDTHTNCKNEACHLLFIQCSDCAETLNGCCSEACKDVLLLPAEAQKELRKGIDKGRQVFKKGRSQNLKFKIENS
jgi:UPF0176 protein